MRATVAEPAGSTNTVARRGTGSAANRTAVVPRQRVRRHCAGSRPRPARRTALRLVAVDGHLIQEPSALAQRPAARPAATTRHADNTARTPLRLTRRGRIVITAVAMLAIGAASMAIAGGAQATGRSGASDTAASGVTKVEIRPGQNLWSVAEAYDPGADTRVVIQEILQMNSLRTDQVQPGQVLWVPRR